MALVNAAEAASAGSSSRASRHDRRRGGEPKLTFDIDVVVHLSRGDIERFIALFSEGDFYCPPSDVIQIECARRTHGHFNLIHPESGFKADIYPDAQDPLHQWAFNNRVRVALTMDLSVWIAPAEYVIIRKLEYFREGGSEKHLEDIGKMFPQAPRRWISTS